MTVVNAMGHHPVRLTDATGCTSCAKCARVCPADIRLDLINRKLSLEVERQYGKVGLDPEEKSALVDFRMDDSEEFIL